MLSRSGKPDTASRGRRSHSNGGLFVDTWGIIHIRIPHNDKGNRRAKAYRTTYVSLHCEKSSVSVGEITAVSAQTRAFPTCVRCLGMELSDV